MGERSSRYTYASGCFSLAKLLLNKGIGDEIPPPVFYVGIWLLAFGNPNTAAQYFSHIAKAVLIAGCEGDDWCPPSKRDQLKAIKSDKTWLPEELPAVFARPQVRAQWEWGRVQNPGYGFIARCSYQWGLRVKSEGILALREVFTLNPSDLTVKWHFTKRKHKQFPHDLIRPCTCKKEEDSGEPIKSIFCAYHSAAEILALTFPGEYLFIDSDTGRPFQYQRLNRFLKAWGKASNLPNWKKLATQGWRRGMACDKARKSESLEQILHGGDWSPKSKSYLLYIASAYGDVEAKSAAQALAGEDSDEDD